jgi:aldehyde:ferredoxin oxidoreductase
MFILKNNDTPAMQKCNRLTGERFVQAVTESAAGCKSPVVFCNGKVSCNSLVMREPVPKT